MSEWMTAATVRQKLARLWDRGDWLAARVQGESLFPLTIAGRKPGPRDLRHDYPAVRAWVQALRAASREARGFGYAIEWKPVDHGANELPARVYVPTEADGLQLLGRAEEAARFDGLVTSTRERFPELGDWLVARPLQLLEHAGVWPQVLAVLDWFRSHPRPGIYLRQLDIAGVDTKFIEAHRGLLSALLDQVLPPAAVDAEARGARGFARRYGLREQPPLVRLRLLDPSLALHGVDDLSMPADQFAQLQLPVRRVFVTENEVNGLAFPQHPDSLVVFGLGYGLERLVAAPWLQQVQVWYWGDLDSHGFAMLDRLRARLPHVRSLLMDRHTLLAHRSLWGQEPPDARFSGAPRRLTEAEYALYADLRDDVLGERVRLEQERIAFGYLQRVLASLQSGPPTEPDRD